MKYLKKLLWLLGLVLLITLAAAGVGIFGIAPNLPKDRKLFAAVELKLENNEKKVTDNPAIGEFKV